MIIYSRELNGGYYDLTSLIKNKFYISEHIENPIEYINEKGYDVLVNYDSNGKPFYNIRKVQL